MRKVLAVALREYRAAVQTRTFLLSLLLMPLIALLSFGVQAQANKAESYKTKRYAVVDRTGELRPAIERAVVRHNELELDNPITKVREAPMFALEFVAPSADETSAILAQRLELSLRHQRSEIDGFLEIGPEVYAIATRDHVLDERRGVRYQSEKAADRDFARWASRVVSAAVLERRFERSGISADLVRELQTPVPQQVKGLTVREPVTGTIKDASEESRVASFILPAILAALMFLMVLLGAVPAMQGVVEEKQQRIAEVLLGSVSPFQLMLGKLLGVVAVSLTISAVYMSGGYVVASRYGVTTLLGPGLLAWFILFTMLASLMYGSLYMAVGAAASDLKETQSLQMPLMMVAMLPMLVLGPVMRDPAGKLALVGSFFPFSAPMIMIARLSTAGGVPIWQPILAATSVLLVALACVWASSRVFRVGLLMQGKGVRLQDLARWVISG